MKKIYLMFNLLLILFLICSCNPSINKQEQQIFEIQYIIGHQIIGEKIDVFHDKITLKTIEHDDLSRYDLYCDFGYLYFDYFDFKGNEFYKIARDKFYWSYYYDIEGNPIQELEYFNKAYILLVKRVENNIVGYSIIEVVQDKENLNYCNVEIVESFIFPKIKDKYQDISYEYIRESFNTLKEIRK